MAQLLLDHCPAWVKPVGYYGLLLLTSRPHRGRRTGHGAVSTRITG